MVSLNQELLLSIASIGSFVRTHPISNPSEKFQEEVHQVLDHLKQAAKGLEADNFPEVAGLYEEQEGPAISAAEKKVTTHSPSALAPQGSLSDMHLLMDQLSWTRQVSKRLRKEIVGN